jgi:CBS domain containing-hemolysin-like protein
MINTNTLIWIIIAWLMIIFFAGIEIAFANANRLTIELKKKQGLHRSILLSGFLDNPSRFISALQIGFDIFLVIFGLLVGETLSPFWEWIIRKTVVPQAWVDILRLMFETFTSTLFILFFGELIPKALFRAKSDSLLDFFAPVSNFFYSLFHPISVFFYRHFRMDTKICF